MFGRVVPLLIVMAWLASMSWLVWTKVLPPLRVGDPPTYRNLLEDFDRGLTAEVGWDLFINGQRVGRADNQIVRRGDDVVELRNTVHIPELRLGLLMPKWLAGVVSESDAGAVELKSFSRVELDPLGQLLRLESNVRLSDFEIRLRGQVEQNRLNLMIRSGDFKFPVSSRLPPSGLVSVGFSPETHLSRLSIGQTWTAPVVSPFTAPGGSLQILQARVDRAEEIEWNGQTVPTLVVVYESDSGAGLATPDEPEGQMWVRKDGAVLKQQMRVQNARFEFVRDPRDLEPGKKSRSKSGR